MAVVQNISVYEKCVPHFSQSCSHQGTSTGGDTVATVQNIGFY